MKKLKIVVGLEPSKIANYYVFLKALHTSSSAKNAVKEKKM